VTAMEPSQIDQKKTFLQKNQSHRVIRVAILAEEPLGWGSGKHFFPIILDKYTWLIKDITYTISTQYIFDEDILKGRLTTGEFDVLLVPGGGVGDGQAMMKGFHFSRSVSKWKTNISRFIEEGGGYVGICGGTALITDLKTAEGKPQTFLERLYNNSSLKVTCVSSYYKSIAFPLFYPFQKNHAEKIGAIAYVFSFAPGETVDGTRIHTGGVPLDFQICKTHPIFSDFQQGTERIRWWGGPALMIPKHPSRDVQVLAKYPKQDLSENPSTRIHAWRYVGGIRGLFHGFLQALHYIKKQNDVLRNVFLYTYYMAGNWSRTDKIIELDYADKPCITTEIYPNENKGRILLCAAHPEYMIWWGGHITDDINNQSTCLGIGLHKWKDIATLSKYAHKELTHTWWMVRRFVAWVAKVQDDHLPPIQKEEFIDEKSVLLKNVFWDGSMQNQMENI
jgi:putative intracellular protease/amidase